MSEYSESFPAMAAEARRIGKRVLAALAEAGRLREPGDDVRAAALAELASNHRRITTLMVEMSDTQPAPEEKP